MNFYELKTHATMKQYNRGKWWIDADIIPAVVIPADTVNDAIELYKAHAEKSYISISDNAIKHKDPMFIDTPAGTLQTGYVITASADFQNDKNYKWSKQYIDLWVSITELKNAFTPADELQKIASRILSVDHYGAMDADTTPGAVINALQNNPLAIIDALLDEIDNIHTIA